MGTGLCLAQRTRDDENVIQNNSKSGHAKDIFRLE